MHISFLQLISISPSCYLDKTAKPFRLDRKEAVTCDMKHDYTDEQKTYNGGLVDKFVEYTGSTYLRTDTR